MYVRFTVIHTIGSYSSSTELKLSMYLKFHLLHIIHYHVVVMLLVLIEYFRSFETSYLDALIQYLQGPWL